MNLSSRNKKEIIINHQTINNLIKYFITIDFKFEIFHIYFIPIIFPSKRLKIYCIVQVSQNYQITTHKIDK